MLKLLGFLFPTGLPRLLRYYIYTLCRAGHVGPPAVDKQETTARAREGKMERH